MKASTDFNILGDPTMTPAKFYSIPLLIRFSPYKSSYGTLASGVCSVKGINSHINEMEFKFLIETIFIGYKPIKLFIPLV
jgi:hypothetical protein